MTTAIMQKAAKPYELKFEHKPAYLYVRVESSEPRESSAVDYLRDITNHCRQDDCRKVVIEKRIPGRLGVWDVFSVATRFPLMGKKLTKIAVVDKYLERSERKEFSVMVGRESGLDFHVFTSMSEAENWLLNDNTKGH
jgi:hypothetical protein